MFSPATRKPKSSSGKEQYLANSVPDSPITPLSGNRRPSNENSIPIRPSTGTPAPWGSRLSVLARVPSEKQNEKGDGTDSIQPVYVAEFPQVVRDEQSTSLQKHAPAGNACIAGGIDRTTSLSWIICNGKLFIWSYLSHTASRKCIVLEPPFSVLENGNDWLLCVVSWDSTYRTRNKYAQQCNSTGIVMCNRKTQVVLYWPNIYSEGGTCRVASLTSFDESGVIYSPSDVKSSPKHGQRNKLRSSSFGSGLFNSLIASPIPDSCLECIALSCNSNGELWLFHCGPTGINPKRVDKDNQNLSSQSSGSSNGYPRSMTWRFPLISEEEIYDRQFFLLTHREIQCFNVKLSLDLDVAKLWSHEIVGTDGDSGIKKDLAGEKQIWPLDMQVDRGKVFNILVATLCIDRISSSSFMQYSLLTMQYKLTNPVGERVLEKKAPIQVIIPKARVEADDFLFSMRLRVGGKPSGSAIILSSDGTASVSNYYRNATRLYQFDLPYDAGKVLDASVFPSSTNDEGEDGAWVVLTEKAGVWAIPEKAVLLGGVEPPERSLSSKGSSKEGSSQGERRNLTFSANIAPRRTSTEAWDAGDKQTAALSAGIVRRNARDEESEALLGHLFHEFLTSGQVDGSLEKLRTAGAFERDGGTNVFARLSKSIVDTLAKHWTTTRGAEILAMAVVSTQLMDKHRKHQKFLQFLALSKCHEELCSRQRHCLQMIVEHGEKLAGMIQLRELQNMIYQNQSNSGNHLLGSLWDLIQLVGERARRNAVLLMDRDNAEVFYSKVSDLEEVFYCLDRELEYLVRTDQQYGAQIQRACELSNACATLVKSAMLYRNEHHTWYPSPEGLAPWYSQPVVRNGLWNLAFFMCQLLSKRSGVDGSSTSDLFSHLEVMSDVLLEAYTGAVTAKLELGEEHTGLSEEYQSRRDVLLHALYQQAKCFLDAQYQDAKWIPKEPREVIHTKLFSHLLSIARRHEGYQTLWDVSCDLNDSVLLRNLMRESMGPKRGFSYFVFRQLYSSRQLPKLLRLGEEFPEDFSTFVKEHPEIAWLHELFLHQFSSASETLHQLALSQHNALISTAEEDMNLKVAKHGPTLAERKRLLNLSKIAALAGKDTGYDSRIKRIEADLRILKLQEEIIKLVSEAEEENISSGQDLLLPRNLIELCLRGANPELSLLAFQVFAWTSSSFRKSNKTLLEECWKNAADQDDWGTLYQAYTAEGWSDDETLRILRKTMICQASRRCYGPESETFEGAFDEVLPLRLEKSEEALILKDSSLSSSSVEAILMQHKNFPDAGKLMLTAIMLGGEVEEGPAPME